ncbi:MAG TPA: hypothetical protein VFQ13_01700 [Anaerolineales bacterium]|nr:hypothetical protein [Anaerolineales bacterium]
MKRQTITMAATLLLILSLLVPSSAAAAPAAAPPVPVPEGPPNGATDQPLIVTVRWAMYHDGEIYRVQVSQNPNFTSLLVDAKVEFATGYVLYGILQKNTVYYWRVNATSNGQTSAWSPVWNFRVTNRRIPAAPTLASPANGATGIPSSPTLSWNPVPGADSYDIEVFGLPPAQRYAYVGTSITLTGFQAPYTKRFGWHVRARNPAGVSEWSPMWFFNMK